EGCWIALPFFTSPLCGRGRRAISAFTRVFDALWRAGCGVDANGLNGTPHPVSRWRSKPPSPTRGEGRGEGLRHCKEYLRRSNPEVPETGLLRFARNDESAVDLLHLHPHK